MGPYSLDLRKRVLKYVEETKDKKKASELFNVGIATVYRWIARKAETGKIEHSLRKSHKKKIDDKKLIEYVEKYPDHFLSEIGEHFKTTLQAIFYALKRLKIKRKKRSRSIRKGMRKEEKSL